MSNGFFATSSSVEGLFAGFDSQQYPITGSREITKPEGGDASFDNTNGEMTIPVLNYKDTQYKIILTLARADEEKIIFELTDAEKISSTSIFSKSSKQAKKSPFDISPPETASSSEASFDDASGELIVPVLNLGEDKFRLVLVLKNSGGIGKTMFELVSAEQL